MLPHAAQLVRRRPGRANRGHIDVIACSMVRDRKYWQMNAAVAGQCTYRTYSQTAARALLRGRHLAFVGDSVMRKMYYTVWQLILSKARRRVLLTPAAPHSKASMSPVHCVLPRQYMRHHLD